MQYPVFVQNTSPNSQKLQGFDWASPDNIGTTTPAMATFTTLNATLANLESVTLGSANVPLSTASGYVNVAALDLTAKGSLITSDGSAATTLPVGSNDQLLTANNASANGIQWTSNVTLATVDATTITGDTFVAGSGNVTLNNAFGKLLTSALDLASQGSLITSDGTNAMVLPLGVDGQVLVANSTEVHGIEWVSGVSLTVVNATTINATTVNSSFFVAGTGNVAVTNATGFVNLSALGFTAKGDLATYDGTQGTRLPVGSNGQLLQANSATSTGLEWVSSTINWNNIGNPTANLALAMGTFTTDFTWGDTNGFTLINSGSTTTVLTLRNTNTTTSAPFLRINETSGNLVFRVARSATDSTACALQFYNSTSGADLRTFMQQQITTNQFLFNTTARFRFIVNGNQILDLQNNHLEANDGTVSLPAFSFFNETSTGFYRATTSTLSATIAGTERTRLTTKALNLTNGTHLCASGSTPTATPQVALGTSGQSASLGAGSTDFAGTVQFTRGTGGTNTGLAVRVNFANNYTSTPIAVVISASSTNASTEAWYETNRSTTGFTIGTPGVLANSTTYQVSYIVIGQTE